MREILFRGKRIDNGEWVFGDLSQHKTGKKFIKCGDARSSFQVDESTICQFIGLLDKNGNKIWENDIVDASMAWWNAFGPAGHDSPIIPVEWDDGYCGFTPFADYDCDCGVYIASEEVEVIGNVFDNKELLEK